MEDLLYGSQAMQPNLVVLLAETFHKCEEHAANSADNRASSTSALSPLVSTRGGDNEAAQRSASAPALNSADRVASRPFVVTSQDGGPASEIQDGGGCCEIQDGCRTTARKAQSETNVSRASFTSPFQLSFTADIDLDASDENVVANGEPASENQDPFSGIFRRAVLAGVGGRKFSAPNLREDTGGSPRLPPKHEPPLLTKRAKQKPKQLAAGDWDAVDEGIEGRSHDFPVPRVLSPFPPPCLSP